MGAVTRRTKSHNPALCAQLCAQLAQHPIRVCGLCVCGVQCWAYRLATYLTKLTQYF
jgi:hypothetical protein